MLWQKSKALGQRPSDLIGLARDSYEAYCVDEAVTYFGIMLENMLSDAGQRPSKEDRKSQAARERVLDKIFSKEDQKQGTGFADPASMFG